MDGWDASANLLRAPFFLLYNLIQSGGDNPESEDDHLRFSNRNKDSYMNEVEEQLKYLQIFYWLKLSLIGIRDCLVTACRRGIRPAMAIGGSGMSLKKMENNEMRISHKTVNTKPINGCIALSTKLKYSIKLKEI